MAGKALANIRKFDQKLIDELWDIRVRDQKPWKELPDVYMTLLGDNPNKETKPDWRTLRDAIMRSVDVYVMPTRVHKKMRTRIAEEFEKADLHAMLMKVLLSRYGEWNLLHQRMLTHAAAAGLYDSGEEKISVPEFTPKDRTRMDMLANEVLSTLLRIADMMKTMHITDNSLFELMEQISGVSPGVKKYGSTETPAIAAEALEKMQRQSELMMREINEKHRREGQGHYRSPVISVENVLEVD